jgi:DNA topoisomerase-1
MASGGYESARTYPSNLGGLVAAARPSPGPRDGGLLGDLDVSQPEQLAEAAGLSYVQDTIPGITRRRAGKGFSYRDPQGRRITDKRTLERIRSLAVPPAWTDVWICPEPAGHLQATGWDAKGRKQYRYHADWRKVRDAVKFERLLDFGSALPRLRARVEADLGRSGLTHDRVVAAVVRLLDETQIRVGNEEYARENHSYGLTTLRDRHAEITPTRIHLMFRGKSGKLGERTVKDRRLARVVRRCQDLPGQILFQYVGDDGGPHPVDSRDVNHYLQEVTGGPFTAKDFRTWAASVAVAARLRAQGEPASGTGAKKAVVAAIKEAAAELANTPAVCRASYVHPAVVDAHLDGRLAAVESRDVRRQLATTPGLSEDEALLMVLLRREQAEALARAGLDVDVRSS